LWLAAESLTLEYAGETLSRYDVQYVPDSIKLKEITRPRLFETSYMLAQFRLFDLEDALGEGWLKALKLEGYAPLSPDRRLPWSETNPCPLARQGPPAATAAATSLPLNAPCLCSGQGPL
jgi:hypothetical protein